MCLGCLIGEELCYSLDLRLLIRLNVFIVEKRVPSIFLDVTPEACKDYKISAGHCTKEDVKPLTEGSRCNRKEKYCKQEQQDCGTLEGNK